MAKEQHAHLYKRVKLGDFVVYKCFLPGCPHWVRKELVIGALCICWRCRQETIMTPGMAKQAKPHCSDCTYERPKLSGAA